MKYDLKDTTFILPVRLDSMIRLENLLLTLENLESDFHTNIIVVEASYYNSGVLKQLVSNSISCYFIEDKDPIFHRTKHLNTISRKVNTDIIGIWDADVILESSQIIDAIQHIRNRKCDFAYPYDGRFLDTSEIIRNHYLLHKDVNFLKKNTPKMRLLYSSIKEGNSQGGAFLISTEKYKLSGLENEMFYGWGVEDSERYHRWLIFNFTMYRSKGALFHLSHPRDINGTMRSQYHYAKTEDELNKIMDSTKEELENRFHNK
jgi:predicted glycosyltransferase involved in capsule biosynthesis